MIDIPFYKNPVEQINSEYLRQAMSDDCKKLIDSFEDDFGDYVGAAHAISTINASVAIHLALCAIDIKRGDKILCSVNIHPSIPSAIRQFDAEPIFLDIDESTYNIDLNQLESALENNQERKLRGVIVSFIAGQVVDMDRFYSIVKSNNIFAIEDATDALGATYENKKIGSFGADMTIFSFTPFRENISASCAMITTNDDDLYTRALLFKNNGIVKESSVLNYVYNVTEIGCGYSATGLDVAYCKSIFDTLFGDIQKRKLIASKYKKGFEKTPHIKVEEAKFDHTYQVFMIKIDKNRDAFAKELAKRGIETDVKYMPIHMTKYYKQKYDLKITAFPNALRMYATILSIPIYSRLSSTNVDRIIQAINEIAENRKW